MKDFSKIENQRKTCAIIYLLGLISIGVGVFLLFSTQTAGVLIIAFIGIILLIVARIMFSIVRSKFKNIYLKDLISNMFDKANYFPRKGIVPANVYRCNFLKKADRFLSEDLIIGKIGDVNFYTSDVKLEERHVRRSRNSTHVYYMTYFLGRFFEFDFPKDFKGHVIVSEGALPVYGQGYKKVKLESEEFNRKFSVYATDEHTAFYILTPHFMESIMELEKRNPGNIKLSFIGNTFNVAINNFKDTFEIKLFKKIDQKLISEFKQDLVVIVDLANELKLNRKIFKY